jgi:hypothetical protein
MRIPIFIVSVLVGIYVVEEFFNAPFLSPIKTGLDNWGSIILAVAAIFGYFFMVTNRIRRLGRQVQQPWSKETFANAVVLIMFFIFAILAFIETTAGPNYSMLFSYLPGYVTPTGFHGYFGLYTLYRLVRYDDMYTLLYFGTFAFKSFAAIGVVQFYIPAIYSLYQWIRYVPYNATFMGTLAAGGIGMVILGIRAIIGREPGLIELEKV